MNREEFISTLRSEIVEMVANQLSTKAMRYGYSDVPLQGSIQWRPLVLIIGNYSSGKSSLINEFLGGTIQATGQAPTDDCFTVITYDDTVPASEGIRVTEERDGKALLNDPEYPFTSLRKQGQRFASHFRIKKVNSPFLKDLAIIDTPGMLDSVTERDRGYNYQEVIADLAQKSGLILVLFDAHKAGTVREAHMSIRETLNFATFEDRVVFVLNRIDECTTFNDLLRVYGTLCWNLSQITGRKDIPMIRLTYSPQVAAKNLATCTASDGPNAFLPLLENQRENLKQMILDTPRKQLDHLAAYYETHAERLSHYLEAVASFRERCRSHRVRKLFTGFLVGVLGWGLTVFLTTSFGLGALGLHMLSLIGGVVGVVLLLIWGSAVQPRMEATFKERLIEDAESLTSLKDQTRRDSWDAIRDRVVAHLRETKVKYSLYEIRRDSDVIQRRYEKTAKEIREVMSNFPSLTPTELAELTAPILTFDDRDDYFQYLFEYDLMDPTRLILESERYN